MGQREKAWDHPEGFPGPREVDHYHEWRQRWVFRGYYNTVPNGYYCIHCLEVREGSDGS